MMLRTLAAAALLACPGCAQERTTAGEDAVREVQQRIAALRIVDLAVGADETRLSVEESITVEDLRGERLDDDPPVLGTPAQAYPAEHTDGFAPGTAPYCAPDIEPFRLRSFTAEFNYGGWHNFDMMGYAATHGFSVVYPYVMQDTSHFPEGTRWLRWGSFLDWHQSFANRGIAWGRYDLLADLDVVNELLTTTDVWQPGADWISMLDLEHGGPLSPDELRAQGWYPADAPEDEREDFERRYYEGYLATYTAPIEALRQRGWTSAGVYPQPYGSGWFALLGLADKGLTGIPDPQTHWPWLRYGRAMYEAQDVLYPDIYVYYWSPQNVAYTLARIDFDMALIRSEAERRPYRPYFWPLLHGGDAEPHWWAQQPLPNEDMRAMFLLPFLAGCDGVVLWNWSDVGNHHVPPPLWRSGQTTAAGDQEVEGGIGADVMVGEPFELRPENAAPADPPTAIKRYDVLAIVNVDAATNTVRFQHIDTRQQEGGPRLDPNKPTFAMAQGNLASHLRPPSEAVAGAIEGLALAKAFEPILREGEVKVDVPALDQFAKTLPIIRRVKLGAYHIIATYDPLCVQGGEPREVVLADFDGLEGRTVVVPADRQVRIFTVREVR